MKRIVKFVRLQRGEKLLLARALAYLAAARWVLLVRQFDSVRRRAARFRPAATGSSTRPTAECIAWSIAAASRLVPGASNCLVRALAAHRMLSYFGYPSEVRIGASKPAEGKLAAHAWVESQGKVLLGDFEEGRYVPLGEGAEALIESPPVDRSWLRK